MRFLIVTSIAAMLLLSGCYVGVRGHGHYRYRHHYHHRHHGHHHWNAAGPAIAEASKINAITILPAALPDDIEGEFTKGEEAAWRAEWPNRASQLVADNLTKGTDSAVTGSVSETRPTSGYYLTLAITYIDVGDKSPNADGTPRERGSALSAHGVIMNAATGQMVADVKFSESAGWTGDIPFDAFMSRVGNSLADWFKEKRKG